MSSTRLILIFLVVQMPNVLWAILDLDALAVVNSKVALFAYARVVIEAVEAVEVTHRVNAEVAKVLTIVWSTLELFVLLAFLH
jgi:NADH:ubiquinone oxidoreductase subunit 2 (subunit N)